MGMDDERRSNGGPNGSEAWTAETLVQWVYAQQLADRVARWGGGHAMPSGARVMSGIVEDRARLGCRVDGGGHDPGTELHPDADAVHRWMLDRCENIELGLVIQHARHGTRPETYTRRPPRWHPQYDERGRIVVVYADKAKRRPIYCPVYRSPDPDSVDVARATYAAWHAILADLVAELGNGGLKTGQIAGVGAPARPWEQTVLDLRREND